MLCCKFTGKTAKQINCDELKSVINWYKTKDNGKMPEIKKIIAMYKKMQWEGRNLPSCSQNTSDNECYSDG